MLKLTMGAAGDASLLRSGSNLLPGSNADNLHPTRPRGSCLTYSLSRHHVWCCLCYFSHSPMHLGVLCQLASSCIVLCPMPPDPWGWLRSFIRRLCSHYHSGLWPVSIMPLFKRRSSFCALTSPRPMIPFFVMDVRQRSVGGQLACSAHRPTHSGSCRHAMYAVSPYCSSCTVVLIFSPAHSQTQHSLLLESYISRKL